MENISSATPNWEMTPTMSFSLSGISPNPPGPTSTPASMYPTTADCLSRSQSTPSTPAQPRRISRSRISSQNRALDTS